MEYIKRVTVDEIAALTTLSPHVFERTALKLGTFYRKEHPKLACSPNGVTSP